MTSLPDTLAAAIDAALPPCESRLCAGKSDPARATHAIRLRACGCVYLVCAPCGLRYQWNLTRSKWSTRRVTLRCVRCRTRGAGDYRLLATVEEIA